MVTLYTQKRQNALNPYLSPAKQTQQDGGEAEPDKENPTEDKDVVEEEKVKEPQEKEKDDEEPMETEEESAGSFKSAY